MGCNRGEVTLLRSKKDLEHVDGLFRHLVELFYQIPYCGSFGVSCSGHFDETGSADENNPDSFRPSPWGHLNIAVMPDEEHIPKLLELLKTAIGKEADATFKKITHLFGPPEGSRIEIWEIRIGDNGTIEGFGETYCGGSVKKEGNEKMYQNSKRRCGEIALFWGNLGETVAVFCDAYDFANLDVEKRRKEIFGVWATPENV